MPTRSPSTLYSLTTIGGGAVTREPPVERADDAGGVDTAHKHRIDGHFFLGGRDPSGRGGIDAADDELGAHPPVAAALDAGDWVGVHADRRLEPAQDGEAGSEFRDVFRSYLDPTHDRFAGGRARGSTGRGRSGSSPVAVTELDEPHDQAEGDDRRRHAEHRCHPPGWPRFTRGADEGGADPGLLVRRQVVSRRRCVHQAASSDVVSATTGGVSRFRSRARALLTRARTLTSAIPSTAAVSA